jgi:protein phosphatase 1 regulatory subunit 11
MTMTEHATAPPQESQDEVLTLTLRARPSVSWDNAVVDNEGMGRKSSKRCCIFHKQRPFGESSTDSSDYESAGSAASGDDGENDGDKKPRATRKKGSKKIARPKKDDQVPDYQRFHA